MGSHLVLGLLAIAACGRSGFDALEARYVDDSEDTFGLGTFGAGLAWQGDRVALGGPPFTSTSATFVSRTFDSGTADTRWSTLAWKPIGPYGRPLPDDAATETGYVEGATSMASDHLLLHLDDDSFTDGGSIPDSSGFEHDGTMVFAGQGASRIDGVFGGGVDLARDAYVTIDGTRFDFGTGDLTFAIWVKMFDCSESNDNRVALGGEGPAGAPHVWLGALCPDTCPGNDGANWFVSGQRATPNEAGASGCSGVNLSDGAWHHLAGVKEGHTPATVRLYADGREIASATHDYGTASFDYTGGEIRLGSFNLSDPQYHTRIAVDEAAIWKRALSAAEIDGLYHRGALQLRFQFRACNDACDDELFVGPDGTSATYFSEADLVGVPGSQRGNLEPLQLRGRLAQYQALFDTGSPRASPGLARVELGSLE